MDLQPYSHNCFSKISRTLFDFLTNTYWVSSFQRNNLQIFRTGVSCFSVTLFYSTLLALTHGQNGWRNLFSSCAVVSVFCSGGKQFLVLHTPYVLRVPYSCGVVLVFFNLVGNSFWQYVLSVRYSCAVVSTFCCCGKANLVQIFLLNPRIFFSYFLLCMDLQPNSHDFFSKISRTLFDFLNNTCWVSLFQRNNSQIFHSGVSYFSVTLFYSTCLALTHGQNHRQRLKYTCCVGWKNFFPVVLLCQVFVLAQNRCWFYILLMYLEYHTVVVWCQFFWFWWEMVFGVAYVLSVQYSCAVVSVFWLWQES